MVGQGLHQGRVFQTSSSAAGVASCILILCIASAASQSNPEKQKAPRGTILPDLIFVQSPVVVSGDLPQRFPQGSRLVRLSSGPKSSGPSILTPDLFAVADPEMDFEGAKVLFSAQKTAEDRWQIWEMDVNGANQHQITRCKADCARAAYLPGDEIVFTVTEQKGKETGSYLAVAKHDGTDVRRITFGPASFQLETVLRDGRILASAPWPLVGGTNSSKTRLFYTLRPDGTGLDSLRCEHEQVRVQTDGVELEDGSIAFIEKARSGNENGGELALIRRGASQESALAGKESVYRSPRQISADGLIVAKHQASPTSPAAKFNLYAVHMGGGTSGELVFSDPKLSSIQAIPVAAHVVPKKFWSLLGEDSAAGYFISLDSYMTADDSHGRFSTPIVQVRVLTPGTSSGEARTLGKAPVEKDGSFYVQVPANQPIRFELLDAKGQTVHAEKGWIWARPDEQRGCPGCHGSKAIVPENHWPLTLKRFDTPTHLGETQNGSSNSQAK